MAIKEKPLIDAASRTGPPPGFLFSNPFLAGFFSAMMCAAFGAFAVLIFAIGYAADDSLEVLEAMRWGAIAGLVLNIIVLIGIAFSAGAEPEETRARLLFVLGGVMGVVSLVIADRLALEHVRVWLIENGPI